MLAGPLAGLSLAQGPTMGPSPSPAPVRAIKTDAALPDLRETAPAPKESFFDKVKRRLRGAPSPTQVRDYGPQIQAEFAAAQQRFNEKQYSRAAGLYYGLAKRYRDSHLEEEALFMAAESDYFDRKLPRAEDTYAKLLTKYPTTRFLPHAVQRIYDIAYQWLEDSQLRAAGKPPKRTAFTQRINVLDKTRPTFDTYGRGIEAVEHIQQFDPFGPLTDDALMIAASHEFVTEDYPRAADYYERVIADHPKSEHAVRAMILGAQAYLRSYPGPAYEGHYLDDAERLAKAALARSHSLEREQIERLEQMVRTVRLEKARREFFIAHTYEGIKRPLAAKLHYAYVAQQYPDTQWGEDAKAAMARLSGEETGAPSENPVTRLAKRVRRNATPSEGAGAATSAADAAVQPAAHASESPPPEAK
jgi:outer membrane protein assembly factor BamD (BamD/ComL family)